MTIIKLGGCNGSGKTTLAREIIALTGAYPKASRRTRKYPDHYVGEYEQREVFVLGSYETTCGGMDTISDKLERLALIQWAAKQKSAIVFFEGLITGKTYGAIGALSEQHVAKKRQWLYAFMNTPFEVCAERVLKRRLEKGNPAPFDPERTMRSTFNSCVALQDAVSTGQRATGSIMQHPVFIARHNRPPAEEAVRLLNVAYEL